MRRHRFPRRLPLTAPVASATRDSALPSAPPRRPLRRAADACDRGYHAGPDGIVILALAAPGEARAHPGQPSAAASLESRAPIADRSARQAWPTLIGQVVQPLLLRVAAHARNVDDAAVVVDHYGTSPSAERLIGTERRARFSARRYWLLQRNLDRIQKRVDAARDGGIARCTTFGPTRSATAAWLDHGAHSPLSEWRSSGAAGLLSRTTLGPRTGAGLACSRAARGGLGPSRARDLRRSVGRALPTAGETQRDASENP
jgi:hypothetical protein